jgi:hypothetical protein
MAGMNAPRIVIGGAVAGAVIFVIEGIASQLYAGPMEAALAEHNLSISMSVGGFVTAALVSLFVGIALVWFYAAARPRFGPGPKTAALVAAFFWLGATVTSVLGYRMVGLYPDALLLQWIALGLVEMILAAMAGGWIYREA